MAVESEFLNKQTSTGSIRPFDARRDMASVADLIEQCFSDTLDQDGKRYLNQMRDYARNPAFIQWAPINSEWSGSPFLGYIWEEDGKIIGNISLIPFRVNGKRRYMIANVAVHPDHRQSGIATNLTKQALHHSRAKGSDCTWLQVREDNQIATELYTNLGFIERTRRSTWYGKPDFARTSLPPGTTLKTGNGIHWQQREQWLRLNYPGDFTWQLPFKVRLLGPGVIGAISRFLGNVIIQTWSIVRNNSLVASVSWQYGSTVNNYFWLAIPDTSEESTLAALLRYARPQVPKQRQLVLDFPAHKFHEAISASGFVHHQALIWMEYKFEGDILS